MGFREQREGARRQRRSGPRDVAGIAGPDQAGKRGKRWTVTDRNRDQHRHRRDEREADLAGAQVAWPFTVEYEEDRRDREQDGA